MKKKSKVKVDCGCGTSAVDCCGGVKIEKHIPVDVIGVVETKIGDIPVVGTKLSFKDTLGSWRMRWGFGRYGYSIEPGIYAVGKPGNTSPVFVTANYKMSFDRVRKELPWIDCFILVLDTKGINVWCAAGKGTFGTEELIKRITTVELGKIVKHKIIILPQLGAPGVAAHIVRKKTGFSAVYGPVRAKDIPLFMRKGMKTGEKMSRIDFPFKERIVLAPMELVGSYKILAGALLLLIAVNLLVTGRISPRLFPEFLPYIGAVFVGAVLVPALLPVLPGRPFALKGWTAGLVYVALIGNLFYPGTGNYLVWLLILPAITSFIGLNFTGCSTYTSLSGVLKEMRFAIPTIILLTIAGIIIRLL